MITLSYPYPSGSPTVVTLKNPELDDVLIVDIKLKVNLLLSGAISSRRNGNSIRTFNLSFVNLTATEKTNLLTLFQTCKEDDSAILYTDYNSDTWSGKIQNSELTFEYLTKRSETIERYATSFIFIGEEV